MWRYTFTYENNGTQTWVVETTPKTVDELVAMFDNNDDMPDGIQFKIDGIDISDE